MTRAAIAIALVAFSVGSAAAAPIANAKKPKSMVFKQTSRHDSGIEGTARIISLGKHLIRVVIRLNKPLDGAMAHIHFGPCAKEPTEAAPRLWDTLNNTDEHGTSSTIVPDSLQHLRRRSYSLNVHALAAPYQTVACGDLPRR
jgi:hypothetical protein